MAARRGQIEIAARPGDGCPLRRVAQAQVEHTAVARHELQPGIRCRRNPCSIRRGRTTAARRMRSVPCRKRRRRLRRPPASSRRCDPRASCPAPRPAPARCCSRISTATQAAARSSAATARLGPGQRGEFPLDEAGIDLAARHQRMDQQRLEKGEVGGHARDLEPPSASARRSSACGRSAPQAISLASIGS